VITRYATPKAALRSIAAGRRPQRETSGLTQPEPANAAIMTRSHISHIEAGRRIHSKEDARSLDQVLNTGECVEQLLRLQAIYDLALSDALPLQESLTLIRATAKDYGRHD
jgi:transcriptional regulator with XRE-family HTH domain